MTIKSIIQGRDLEQGLDYPNKLILESYILYLILSFKHNNRLRIKITFGQLRMNFIRKLNGEI
ncbi:hypothetical protein BpHYR1_010707 [Brachionus plicatilis]|uniref:Uncharacterized protein n=1 Tax=Brachionus plicatilis TaxID=10195 RepID=A0A3M7SKQ5_BRAPC|nr:hypothetical protein BpHYR1_010707 [Brachionus plicatilis]